MIILISLGRVVQASVKKFRFDVHCIVKINNFIDHLNGSVVKWLNSVNKETNGQAKK